jgi:Mce-associated membrane protein
MSAVDLGPAPGSELSSAPAPLTRRDCVALPALAAAAVLLGAAAGAMSWQYSAQLRAVTAAAESVAVARDTTAAMLSYHPDTVDKDLNAARDRLTGPFADSYTKLINEVVIPGSRKKKISAVAKIPAAASVSATADHAAALVFVDQTVTAGNGPTTSTASSIRVTLDKVNGRWLVSGFDPV